MPKFSNTARHFNRHLRLLLRHDIAKALCIALIWQIFMTSSGILFASALNQITISQGNPVTSDSILSHTMHWDGEWYRQIIIDKYTSADEAAAVFYPLFPLIVGVLHTLTLGMVDYLVLNLILNTLCIGVALYALKKIGDHFVPTHAWWVPVAFLVSPAAFFLHMFYTEALFCAIGFAAYYLALQRKWLACCLLLALATATRLPAVLFIGLCAFEFFNQHQWSIRRILSNRRLFWFFLTPLGFVAYSAYLLSVKNDALAMFHGYDLWSYQKFNLNIFETLSHGVSKIITAAGPTQPFDHVIIVNFLLPIGGIAVVLLASIYSLLKLKNIPLAIFGIVSIILFSLNSNSVSVHRYILPTLVIYLFLVHLCTRRPSLNYLFYAYCYVGVFLQSFLMILFVNNIFAG